MENQIQKITQSMLEQMNEDGVTFITSRRQVLRGRNIQHYLKRLVCKVVKENAIEGEVE